MNARSGRTEAARFEPSDVPPLLPLWLGAGLGACVILVVLCITLFYPLADAQEYRGPLQQMPQAPRLEVAPAAHLARYDAAKQAELERSPVPIDEAMRATARQGWRPRK